MNISPVSVDGEFLNAVFNAIGNLFTGAKRFVDAQNRKKAYKNFYQAEARFDELKSMVNGLGPDFDEFIQYFKKQDQLEQKWKEYRWVAVYISDMRNDISNAVEKFNGLSDDEITDDRRVALADSFVYRVARLDALLTGTGNKKHPICLREGFANYVRQKKRPQDSMIQVVVKRLQGHGSGLYSMNYVDVEMMRPESDLSEQDILDIVAAWELELEVTKVAYAAAEEQFTSGPEAGTGTVNRRVF